MTDGPLSFEDVLKQELDEIHRLRKLREFDPKDGGKWDPTHAEMSERDPRKPDDKATEQARQEQLVGLAFSGGGIRSATFNLGVLQGLARLRLLHRFDYLSTVSGGGYIGSWLSAWLGRDKHEAGKQLDKLQEDLDPSDRAGRSERGGTEPRQLRHLREYSSYLTPRRGLSIDTAHAAALVLRNLLLTLVVPLLVLASAMLFAQGISDLYERFLSAHDVHLLGALVLFGLAIIVIAANLSGIFYSSSAERRRAQPLLVYFLGVAPFLGACWLTAALLWWLRKVDLGQWPSLNFLATFAGYFVLWMFAMAIGGMSRWWKGEGERKANVGELERGRNDFVRRGAFFASLVGGGLLFAISRWMATWPDVLGAGIHTALLFGGPLVAVAFASALGAHVGFAGSGFIDADREWTSRFTGTLLLWTLSVFVVFLVADQGPGVLDRIVEADFRGADDGGAADRAADDWVNLLLKTIFGASWAGTIALGVRWAISEFAPKAGVRRWIVLATPPLFAVGTFVGVSWVVHRVALSADPRDWFVPWAWFAALLVPALVLSFQIGVNRFSLHSVYRNRLVRCYLGASTKDRERICNPWTDLAAEDDELRVSDLRAENGYRGPYPLICTTLNLVATQRLAWQKRKAASFVFAPLYSGFEVEPTASYSTAKGTPLNVAAPGVLADHRDADRCRLRAELATEPSKGSLDLNADGSFTYTPDADFTGTDRFTYRTQDPGRAPSEAVAVSIEVTPLNLRILNDGFRSSADYGDKVRLGTAMAISGAAVSPNMGHHSSRAVSLLLSLLNVRLGWWMGNPRHWKQWTSGGPWFGLGYMLLEMLGMTNQSRSHVYLSDGGHFENLGLYELVRRRCRFVLVCDAEEDQSLSFTGLGSAIERCRIDFGVDIRIDVDALRRSAESETTPWHGAVGRIEYLRDEEPFTGILVYLKASLTGNEPIDVQHYASKHPDFPHQTTVDQWFDETQFESYRVLGYHALTDLFDFLDPTKKIEERDKYPNEKLFVRLSERWHAPSPAVVKSFARHGEALNRITELIRSTWELRFLEDQLYPEWRSFREADDAPEPPQLGLPHDYAQRRAGFHACSEMIQLMENVYHDLALETHYDHIDNRGWMNLFRHWSWSSMFRVTWAITASTSGARFQEFCRARLELDVTPWVGVEEGDPRDCNFIEQEILDTVFKIKKADKVKKEDKNVLWVINVRVPDPESREQLGTLLEFPVGIAVVRGDTIRLFRIQDHVRKMGLARAGLIALLEKNPSITEADGVPEVWPKGLEAPSRADARDFERLFASVLAEVSSRPQGASGAGRPGAGS